MCRLKNYIEKIVPIALAVLIIAVCFGTADGARVSRAYSDESDRAAGETRVVGYLPAWSYRAYENLDFAALTHINIAFCNFDSSGEIESGIPDGDMAKIVAEAHASGVKVLAALGGGGNCAGYRQLISSASAIDNTNAKIVAFCEKHGLDGIDLDIELGSTDSIWNNYGAWVVALRSLCDERGWLLSTATAQWVSGGVTAETFALFDYLNVMAYDDDRTGTSSHSSYEFAAECLDYYGTLKSVPAEKLVLGVPFYGRGYGADGKLDWNSYMSFADLVEANAANYERDNYNGVAYTGAATMRKKCRLAKPYGGIMIWEVTLDAPGEFSLLDVIKDELLSAPAAAEVLPGDNGKDNTAGIVAAVVVPSVVALGGIVVVTIILVKRKTAGKKRRST